MNATTISQAQRLAFSPAEIAVRVGLPTSGVRALIRRGDLRAIRAGKHLRVPAAELDRWLGGGAAA